MENYVEGEVNAVGKLKMGSCPRCNNGEVFIDRDHYGWYECCLQCGYSRDLTDVISRLPVTWPRKPQKTAPPMNDSTVFVKEKEVIKAGKVK